jgi:AcrR family transcriptional regulator
VKLDFQFAGVVGVDPMTVLHHFHSKDHLMRMIADRALTYVDFAPATRDWQKDLHCVAAAYRELAHRYPRVFHLHFRFHATGPIDHVSSEIVYGAMLRAGLSEGAAAGQGLAFYAFVLGFALAEAEGLLKAIGPEDEAELSALDITSYPATRTLIRAFKRLNPDKAFENAIDAFIMGVALQSETRSATVAGAAKIAPAGRRPAQVKERSS